MSILLAHHYDNLALESATDLPSLFSAGVDAVNGHIATATQKRTGRASLKVAWTNADAASPTVVLGSRAHWCVHFAAKPTVLGNAVVQWRHSLQGARALVALNGNGTLYFAVANHAWNANFSAVGNFVSRLLTPGAMLSVANWRHVAVEVFFDPAVGYVKFYSDGAKVAEALNISTYPNVDLGAATPDTLLLGGAGGFCHFDDVVVTDNVGLQQEAGFLGDCALHYRPPAALVAGGFTPSAGVDHVAMVSELAQDGDATTLSADAAGTEDIFTPAPLAVTQPLAVIVEAVAKKSDVGLREISAKVNGGEAVAADVLSTSYSRPMRVFPTNPATGLAWTGAQASNPEFGWRIKT